VHDLVERRHLARVAKRQLAQKRPVEISFFIKERLGALAERRKQLVTNFGIIRRGRIHHVAREFIRIKHLGTQLAEKPGDGGFAAADDTGETIDAGIGVRHNGQSGEMLSRKKPKL